MKQFPQNLVIQDAVANTIWHVEETAKSGGKIPVSISGGSDSDIMMDMFERIGYPYGLVIYAWYDTGLEYEATKRHLIDLEKKYGIRIARYRPEMTVAQAVKKYGVPFISKMHSRFIDKLQQKHFGFEDDAEDVLIERYPNCKTGIHYWTNWYGDRFSIRRETCLKEFMIQNHPPKISDQCCTYAKKNTAKKAIKDNNASLNVIGVRRDEGGVRALTYDSCFSEATDKRVAEFRPLFYFSDEDKKLYKNFCGVTYSDCYEVWGFDRTGCSCCPFSSHFEFELETVEQYEPKLYAAANKIFGASYDYTRQYRRFKEELKRERREQKKIKKERESQKDGAHNIRTETDAVSSS